MPKPSKTRITLELDESATEVLYLLRADTGMTSAAVLRMALSRFHMLHNHTCNGGKVIFKHADGTSETIKIL